MNNPWEKISLSDYENHMSLESVKQLQSMNQTMKNQLEEYDVNTVMILGIAGGNGLEHVDLKKYTSVYGVDINEDYLQAVLERYKNLKNILKCLKVDLIHETSKLPQTELLIANLLIEYIGYEAFSKVILQTKPMFVSCVIQINETEKEWVSFSPYIHSFDELGSIHFQMEESKLSETMKNLGYKPIKKSIDSLPNGKSLVRLDYQK